MKTKFTKDGRKVAIVGQLNKTEYIVQEIFVTDDGDEIPQGERFTASSLLDEPVLSYKAKEEQRVLESLDKLKSEKEKLSKELRDLEERRKGAAKWMKQIDLTIKNLPEFDYDFFCDFVCGNFEYAIHVDHNGNPSKWGGRYYTEDDMVDVFLKFEHNSWSGTDKFDVVRLLSVSGSSDGKLDYRVNQYSDGSGFRHNNYVFFKTREELEAWVNEYANRMFSEGKLSESVFDLMVEADLEIPDHLLKKWYDSKLRGNLERQNNDIKSTKERYEKNRLDYQKLYEKYTNRSS